MTSACTIDLARCRTRRRCDVWPGVWPGVADRGDAGHDLLVPRRRCARACSTSRVESRGATFLNTVLDAALRRAAHLAVVHPDTCARPPAPGSRRSGTPATCRPSSRPLMWSPWKCEMITMSIGVAIDARGGEIGHRAGQFAPLLLASAASPVPVSTSDELAAGVDHASDCTAPSNHVWLAWKAATRARRSPPRACTLLTKRVGDRQRV